ncbi:MAG: hypothetical protein EBU90_27200, partial [Proteobacteria bacterium]|nr:hypothetical protein [Pseudomonadota bacterium]
SDKGSENITNSRHNYTLIYNELFKNLFDKNINIFELGIGTTNPNITSHMDLTCKSGASLRAWSEIFPNANIYGADIDKIILFNEDRIKTYYCDERDLNSIKSMWENIDVKFDKDAMKKDFFNLFSTESIKNDNKEEEPLEISVKFNNIVLKKKKYIPLYKRPRTMIKNIDNLLDQFLVDCIPTSFVNKVYDDYKEKLKQSNNSGEQSVGENQVFEFQVL